MAFVKLHDVQDQKTDQTLEAIYAILNRLATGDVAVHNGDSVTLIPGQPVYVASSTGNIPVIKRANAATSSTMPAIGLIVENVAAGQEGLVRQLGLLEDVNTNGFSVGNDLYVSATIAGQLTATAPASGEILQMARVLTKAEAGILLIATAEGVPEGFVDFAYSHMMSGM